MVEMLTPLEIFFNFNSKMEEKIKNYVLTHSRITEEIYKNMERYEFYMTAEDLLENGLVDEIIGGATP